MSGSGAFGRRQSSSQLDAHPLKPFFGSHLDSGENAIQVPNYEDVGNILGDGVKSLLWFWAPVPTPKCITSQSPGEGRPGFHRIIRRVDRLDLTVLTEKRFVRPVGSQNDTASASALLAIER